MDTTLLRRLISQGESSYLDYKSKQYSFIGGTVGEKSELLKDVLAMANAWREVDAYILIGVTEHQPRWTAQNRQLIDRAKPAIT